MTTDPAAAIGLALAHAVRGDYLKAGVQVKKIAEGGPADTYAMMCALAETAVSLPREQAQPAPGEFFALSAVHEDPSLGVDDAPPPLRLAMRFMAAQANRDYDGTHALFWAALETEPEALAESLPILLQAAAQTARERIARAKGSGGA